MNKRLSSIALLMAMFLCCVPTLAQKKVTKEQNELEQVQNNISKDRIMGQKDSNETPKMCAKQAMQADGIVRLSKIEVEPKYLDEYMKFATEVGEVSLRTEPGVLTMYAVSDKENPCLITILETYASGEAYKQHIASAHFQKYKQGTLHMVKSLQLCDQKPLNPTNKLNNYIE